MALNTSTPEVDCELSMTVEEVTRGLPTAEAMWSAPAKAKARADQAPIETSNGATSGVASAC